MSHQLSAISLLDTSVSREDWDAATRRGDFAAAWQICDRLVAARAPGERCWHLPRHEQWVWDGRPLAGRRVLAHLAGGLGVPTWTLLPADADWRWMQPDRTDSPWYPTMRRFRQSRPGDWQPLVDEVFSRLVSLVSAR